MILVLPISLLPVLPYIVQIWLWVSFFFFLYLGDHFALWCITECKCQGAAWLQVFPLFCGHISSSSKRLGPLDFLSASSWAVFFYFLSFFLLRPTHYWRAILFGFLKFCFRFLDAADICLYNDNPERYTQDDWAQKGPIHTHSQKHTLNYTKPETRTRNRPT